MELPKGQMNVIADASVPKGEARLVQDGKVIGKITNIQCPVVQQYKQRRQRTVERFKPNPKITNVTFDPKVSLEQIEKQYVLLALEKYNGSISQAARALGIGKNTIYRHLGKFYGKQYETK